MLHHIISKNSYKTMSALILSLMLSTTALAGTVYTIDEYNNISEEEIDEEEVLKKYAENPEGNKLTINYSGSIDETGAFPIASRRFESKGDDNMYHKSIWEKVGEKYKIYIYDKHYKLDTNNPSHAQFISKTKEYFQKNLPHDYQQNWAKAQTKSSEHLNTKDIPTSEQQPLLMIEVPENQLPYSENKILVVSRDREIEVQSPNYITLNNTLFLTKDALNQEINKIPQGSYKGDELIAHLLSSGEIAQSANGYILDGNSRFGQILLKNHNQLMIPTPTNSNSTNLEISGEKMGSQLVLIDGQEAIDKTPAKEQRTGVIEEKYRKNYKQGDSSNTDDKTHFDYKEEWNKAHGTSPNPDYVDSKEHNVKDKTNNRTTMSSENATPLAKSKSNTNNTRKNIKNHIRSTPDQRLKTANATFKEEEQATESIGYMNMYNDALSQ